MSREPDPRLHQAVALHQTGRLADAAALYQRILASDPNNADALNLLGVVRLSAGDAATATELISRAISLQGRIADYHVNLSQALRAQGRAKEAVVSLRHAVKLSPADGAAWLQLGLAERASGDLAAAVAAFRRATQAEPNDISALNNLATALIEQGHAEEAQPVIERSLAIAPDNPLALGNRGMVLLLCGRPAEAVAPLRHAAEAMPHNAMALNNLGIALQDALQVAEAIEVLRRAVTLAPDNAAVRVSYGNAMKKAGHYDAALVEFERALVLRPEMAEAHSHIGICHFSMSRYDVALAAYDRALAMKPELDQARKNRGMVQLLFGHFDQGWADYFAPPPAILALKQRLARDATFAILLRANQGLGDEIFFLRFLPLLRRRGVTRVMFEGSAKIASILRRVEGLDGLVIQGEPLPACDEVLYISYLPLALGHTGAPPPSLAVAPNAARVAELRARLAAFGPPPYIGVTWRGGTADMLGVLFKLAPIADVGRTLVGLPGTLIALQRLPEDGEIDLLAAAAGRPAHDLTALNDDLEGMLALLSLLDDYVTVSNTNVHLRALAGRTSRVLVPCPPDFRWMAEGDESPWFPGCRVYRQEADRSWEKALADLRRDLRQTFL